MRLDSNGNFEGFNARLGTTDTIQLAGIERFIGSEANDIFFITDTATGLVTIDLTFEGGAGDDFIDGGDGMDAVSFFNRSNEYFLTEAVLADLRSPNSYE